MASAPRSARSCTVRDLALPLPNSPTAPARSMSIVTWMRDFVGGTSNSVPHDWYTISARRCQRRGANVTGASAGRDSNPRHADRGEIDRGGRPRACPVLGTGPSSATGLLRSVTMSRVRQGGHVRAFEGPGFCRDLLGAEAQAHL